MSVIIPTFNRAGLVGRAIESVLRQTRADLCEIVVVDDGSVDDTRAAVARYAPRVRYVYQPNAGLAAARNTGIRATTSEFVGFLDDDDEWLPAKVERQLAAFERWPDVALVAGGALDRDPAGTLTPRVLADMPFDEPADFAGRLFTENVLVMPTVMVRRSVLRQTGGFWPALRRVEDHHLWVRVACRGRCVCLREPLAIYATSTPDALSRNAEAMLRTRLTVYADLRGALRVRPDCRGQWRHGFARRLGELRDLLYRDGRYTEAVACGLRRIAREPWTAQRWEWGVVIRALAEAVARR